MSENEDFSQQREGPKVDEDGFAQEEGTERHYDDHAFMIFVLVTLLIILIPSTIYYIRSFFTKKEVCVDHLCPCERCEKIKEKKLNESKYPSKSSILYFIGFIFLWIFFFILLSQINTGGDAEPVVEQFDPYELLGVTRLDKPSVIRKTFRKLSQLYHPDKLRARKEQGEDIDVEAGEEYYNLLIKAKDTLTDEDKKAIYDRYGDPDGPKSYDVGLALPKWLVSSENMHLVLLSYVGFLMFIVPFFVIRLWKSWKSQEDSGASDDTHKIFQMGIMQHMNMEKRNLFELICLATEFREGLSVLTQNEFDKLRKMMPKENRPPESKTLFKMKFRRLPDTREGILDRKILENSLVPNLLLRSHMCRLQEAFSPPTKELVEKLLVIFPSMIKNSRKRAKRVK